MDQVEAFLAEIQHDPHNFDARLFLADVLEERSDNRADAYRLIGRHHLLAHYVKDRAPYGFMGDNPRYFHTGCWEWWYMDAFPALRSASILASSRLPHDLMYSLVCKYPFPSIAALRSCDYWTQDGSEYALVRAFGRLSETRRKELLELKVGEWEHGVIFKVVAE